MDEMDLIKDRLAHILRSKNLTATQFAEMMQIQPSNVSHLLSGRNKPSLDFLIKLKELFPEYNFDWIIMGKKPITTSSERVGNTQANTLFDSVEIGKPQSIQHDENYLLNDSFTINSDNEEAVRSSHNNSNGLTQIIYVYDDHTFEVYNIRK